MCVTHVKERLISELQQAEFLRISPELGMALSPATHPDPLDKENEPCSPVSFLRSVQVLQLELSDHAAKDHSRVVSSSV